MVAQAKCAPELEVGIEEDLSDFGINQDIDLTFGISLTWDLWTTGKCRKDDIIADQEELEYFESMFALCQKAKDTDATVIINKCKDEGFL